MWGCVAIKRSRKTPLNRRREHPDPGNASIEVRAYGYRERCRSRSLWLGGRSLGRTPSDVSVASDLHRPNSRSLGEIPLGDRLHSPDDFLEQLLFIAGVGRLAEHFCVAIAKVRQAHSDSELSDRHLAAGCWDASGKKTNSVPIRIWELENLKLIQEIEGHSLAVFALDYTSDGKRLISCGSAGDLRFWDTADYTLRARIELPKTGWVHSARFTPDSLGLLCITGRQRNGCDILVMRSQRR